MEIQTTQVSKMGRIGYDYGNAASDINPDEVYQRAERGAATTALYGSRASNGVVMIVTKKVKNKKN
jgi:TonB-dependent SusC/RagA subfamily outer membrane receptor